MIIFEENSALRDRLYLIPSNIVRHLSRTLAQYSDKTNSNGYKRLKHMLYNGYNGNDNQYQAPALTYYEMKRIKNFFDNYTGDRQGLEWILNGGEIMRNWVNDRLLSSAVSVEGDNKRRSDQKKAQTNNIVEPANGSAPVIRIR